MKLRLKKFNVILENIHVKYLINNILESSKIIHEQNRIILWRKSEYQLYRISKKIYKEALQ
jgi:hypothetical protein